MKLKNISKVEKFNKKLKKINSMYSLFTSNASYISELKFKVRRNSSIAAGFSQKKFKSEDFEEIINLNSVVKNKIRDALENERVIIISKE